MADAALFVPAPADVVQELQCAQFAVHPSLTEGMSNAILEEMAAGLPVIACSVGANEVLVASGEHGLIVAPGEAAALARAIDTLRSDPALRQRMGIAARERAGLFSWDRCAQRYERAFEEFVLTRGEVRAP